MFLLGTLGQGVASENTTRYNRNHEQIQQCLGDWKKARLVLARLVRRFLTAFISFDKIRLSRRNIVEKKFKNLLYSQFCYFLGSVVAFQSANTGQNGRSLNILKRSLVRNAILVLFVEY